MADLPGLGLYIHFPWCVRKCPYCDFNSHAVKNGIPEQAYVDALLADLQIDLDLLAGPRRVGSIFMGGGTPSLFSPDALARLLEGVRQRVALADNCEITLEANPGTVESGKFQAFRQLGINRLSIGVQSFNDAHLQVLGRIHCGREAKQAVAIAQQAGFDNLNLDLMFGLPQQSAAQALEDVQTAIDLQPTHISFYQLTLEPNTYFYRFPPSLPEDDAIYAAQRQCQQRLAAAGYQQYEVSAYARPGSQCRHNSQYWQFGDYLGIGAGAHGKISQSLPDRILRTVKPKNPELYLAGQRQGSQSLIDVAQLPLEFLMNHLRLKSGFSRQAFGETTGLALGALQPALSACLDQGLLIETDDGYRCSDQGWDFLDLLLEKFVPA